MAQRLRVLIFLPENPGSTPSTYSDHSQLSLTPVLVDLTLSHRYTWRHKKKYLNKKSFYFLKT